MRLNKLRLGILGIVALLVLSPWILWAQNKIQEHGDGTRPSVMTVSDTVAAFREIRTNRAATGNIALGISSDVAITFSTPFADANYTIQAQLETGGIELFSNPIVLAGSKTASGCTIRVKNVTLATQSATLHILAIHD